ncbi:regulator of chromosome condensation [Stomoxys calcitrans]|uniref:regulator of chromosome condensation n=1 Tax=Stomoxys calcitrans TaxID=35570 RepID=UPI0027E27C53|nr:regulator of chromosome condensation [Stomoxys calcitrans]
MPRVAVRRKADAEAETETTNVDNNNKGETSDTVGPKGKRSRMNFILPLPERPRVVGRALVCGQGDMGQLGLGDDESKFERKRPALIEKVANVVDVKAGGMHNLVLTHDGRVFSFGCNDEGALGRDSSEEGSEFEPSLVKLPGKVLKITAGDSHSACLLEDGRVFAWGSFRDSHGNMGLTLEGNKRTPINVLPDLTCCDIASGADHLAILTCQGKVYTVGCAEQGQLGRVSLRSASGEGRRGKTELLKPGLVITKNKNKPIEAIWATNYCTFLREHQSGIIWAFGLNNYCQLLANAKDLPTIINPINTKIENVKQIAGGQHHTLILKEDGSVLVIGRKDYGRLGLGTVADDVTQLKPITALKGKKVVSVSCGEAQSFALTDDGKLYSWGMGSNHQLGTGSEDDVLEPALIVSKQTEGKRIIRASSGGQHSIFLVEDENQPASEVSVKEKSTAKKATTTASKTKGADKAGQAKKDDPETEAPKINGDISKAEDATTTQSNGSEETKTDEAETASAPPPAKKGRKKK